MKAMKTGLCVLAVAVSAWGAIGCIPQAVTDLFGAYVKLGQGQLAQLTANEVLALHQAIAAASGTTTTLATEQAQAIVDFFVANGVNTPQDLADFAQAVNDDPGSLQGLDDLAAAFEGTDLDFDSGSPSSDDIQGILDVIFGGSV